MARATDQEIDEMGDAQYALECVLARLTEGELARILPGLPPRAYEHVRLTVADYPGGRLSEDFFS